MARAIKLLGQVVFIVLACALAVAVGVTLLASRRVAASGRPAFVGGVAPVVVLSGSMEPTYRVGSMLFIRRVQGADVKVGDVVTFATPGTPSGADGSIVTHRVIGVSDRENGRAYRTKGDANRTEDGWDITADLLIGRPLFAVPYLGRITFFAHTKSGFLLLVVVPAVAIIVNETRSIIREIGRRRTSAEPGR